MPAPLIKSFAKRAGVSEEKAEAAWDKAKDTARAQMQEGTKQYWGLVNVLTQRALGLKESLKVWMEEEAMLAQAPEVQAAGTLINALFWFRDTAHSLHLATKKYSEHMALNELYDDLVADMDRLAEAIQGKLGLLPRVVATAPELLDSPESSQAFVQAAYIWLTGPGKDLLPQNDGTIANIYDEIIEHVLSAKYKLENLA